MDVEDADGGDEGGDEGEGEGGDGGGEQQPRVMFNVAPPLSSRRISGEASFFSSTSPGGDADRRDVVPLLLARTAARLLARAAVRTALARFVGSGRALSTRASRVHAAGNADGSDSPIITGRGVTV